MKTVEHIKLHPLGQRPHKGLPRAARIAIAVLAGWLLGTGAWAATPVIEWVSPPVWLQTEKSTLPARPGMSIDSASWVMTGRGGRAAVRVDADEINLAEDAVWYWAGPRDTGSGNAMQGNVRVGTPQNPERLSVDPDAPRPPMRLHRDGSWRLLIGPGTSRPNATRLGNFMLNSGYPVKLIERGSSDELVEWWVALDGFRQAESALEAGRQLLAQVLGVGQVVVEELPGIAASTLLTPAPTSAEPVAMPVTVAATPLAADASAPNALPSAARPIGTGLTLAGSRSVPFSGSPAATALRSKAVAADAGVPTPRSKAAAAARAADNETPAAKKKRERLEAKAKAKERAKAKALAKKKKLEQQQ